MLREDEYAGTFPVSESVDVFLELIAAVFLGEIDSSFNHQALFHPCLNCEEAYDELAD